MRLAAPPALRHFCLNPNRLLLWSMVSAAGQGLAWHKDSFTTLLSSVVEESFGTTRKCSSLRCLHSPLGRRNEQDSGRRILDTPRSLGVVIDCRST